ncbi:MAG: hypothetical protein NTW93_04090 [Phycisphaerae bacterium]|nr:hypothetical protein [Phycisphaerae bacterium]
MARTKIGTPVKAFRVTDAAAVKLINKRAAVESRSAANAAAITIIESLSRQGKPPKKSNH